MKFKKIITTGRVFITSDNHYAHKNICRGVTNWRTQDGEVPVGSTRDFETIEQMNERLVNAINNVVGHDHHIENDRENIQSRFLSVQHYLEVNINDKNFVLCHYPLQSWNGLNKGVIHLHGHVHLPANRKFGNGKRLDVGVDGNDMVPYSIDAIIKIMSKIPVGSDMSDDHHLDGLVGVVG